MSDKIPEPQIAARFEAETITNDADKLVAVRCPDGSLSVWATVGSPDKAIVISHEDAKRLGRWLLVADLLTAQESVSDVAGRLFDGLNEKEKALVRNRVGKKDGK